MNKKNKQELQEIFNIEEKEDKIFIKINNSSSIMSLYVKTT